MSGILEMRDGYGWAAGGADIQSDENAHHNRHGEQQAPLGREAESAGDVSAEQGEGGDEQAVGQLRANVIKEVARTGDRTHDRRIGDGRAVVAEDCAVEHGPQAYHRGQAVSVSVDCEGDWNCSRH